MNSQFNYLKLFSIVILLLTFDQLSVNIEEDQLNPGTPGNPVDSTNSNMLILISRPFQFFANATKKTGTIPGTRVEVHLEISLQGYVLYLADEIKRPIKFSTSMHYKKCCWYIYIQVHSAGVNGGMAAITMMFLK